MRARQSDVSAGLRATPRAYAHRWAIGSALVLGYLALRLVNLGQLWLASESQSATGPANPSGKPSEYFVHTALPAAPGLGGVLANWDGQWYERIATEGYPTGTESHSANDTWTWAFPPVFPMSVRLVMALTGLGFPAAAVVLNLVLGGIATALLYALLRAPLGTAMALAGALALNTFVSAPLFTLAYSEPAALVFLLLTIRFTLAHRYAPAFAGVLLLAFTRPVAAPLVLVFAAHALARLRNRDAEVFRPASKVLLAACALASVASPFLWNALASALFGATRAASDQTNEPLSGVSRTASMLGTFEFGWIGGVGRIAGVGGALTIVAVLAATLCLAEVAARHLGLSLELRVWGAAYIVFVILVTPPTPGLLRYLLLAAPLLIAVQILPLSWTNRRTGLIVFAVLTAVALWTQWFWIRYLYILDPAPALLPWPP
ncbi:hypothetical protein GCM10009721_41990 [Terrabacter tumescens]|uniref:Glycosyltransferase RgtA/B/C/D-like domain-containing protein n=1 Tax=Terrabacter tumescens TaxID=60443 RepID=A0ABQ2IHZ1_9MICO|nr:hypothetical protein [Terrabacter tumescens]GGN09697.1 hypothetical protein GCM10009721_41990 [Terrabacter tumescens]